MNNNQQVSISPTSTPTSFTISSKFGELTINTSNTITISQGLIGIPKYKKFCLANIPNPRFSLFKALQSLDDYGLTFLVLPITEETNYLSSLELEEIHSFLKIEPQHFNYLLIASSKVVDGIKKIVVNKRAPIFIDVNTQTATQYVLQNTNHEIQFVL